MKLQPDNVIRVTSEPLDSDKCLLSTLINMSEDVSIDGFSMSLHKHDEIITFDISDIFMQNCINVPSLDADNYMKYSTTNCLDLKPFIKALSWKNPTLIRTREEDVLKTLSNIILKIEKNINEFYYYHYDSISNVVNICSDIQAAIKYERGDQKRIFTLFNDKIAISNFDQMSFKGHQEAIYKMNIILEAFDVG